MHTLAEDIDQLGRCLGEVIREQEGDAFLALEERIRLASKASLVLPELASLSAHTAERLVQAFSCYFLLVNVAEEHERVRRVDAAPRPRKQSIEQALRELAAEGHDAASALRLVGKVDLGLTFTAHPTEMRRRTARAHLDAIGALLSRLHEPDGQAEIAAHIEALWSTPRLRDRKPTVRDEVTAGLAYMDVIAQVLPELERDLEESFARTFGPVPGAGGAPPLRVPISLHSWMGGDRDGNPNVTTAVTRETFERHAQMARGSLGRAIDTAFERLSQSPRGDISSDDAPYRATLLRMRAALDEGRGSAIPALVTELDAALERDGQLRSRDRFAKPLVVQSRVFGTHLAALDLREHSRITGAAVAELLRRDGVDGYERAAEPDKVAMLVRALEGAPRSAEAAMPESPELERVLGPMRAAREAALATGERAFGRYIVSMSEDVSDLLEVLVLAREVGLSVVPVPLFETLDDLNNAPAVMRRALALPLYRAAVGDRVQEVMIGYSDSNKDAGFFAANWALYVAQERVAAVCHEAGVRHRFFHGRGTSIGRGGGPMARGMLGQPPGTMDEGLRITEQGEALGDRYSHPALARRNLEQAIYGLLVAAGRPPRRVPAEWAEAMTRAEEASVRAYRALVSHPGFFPFFEAVTPLREIARLHISSRPVWRPSPDGSVSLGSLRAIPWVMAWTQARAIVPGFYGLDAALAVLEEADPELPARMAREWPFFRSLIDNAQMALAKSEMTVFRVYRTLSSDDELGPMIEDVFHRTAAAVQRVTGAPLLANEPRLLRSIELRNPYVEPIHRVQVELLRRARSLREGEELPKDVERALVLTLHGVAAGMRNTG